MTGHRHLWARPAPMPGAGIDNDDTAPAAGTGGLALSVRLPGVVEHHREHLDRAILAYRGGSWLDRPATTAEIRWLSGRLAGEPLPTRVTTRVELVGAGRRRSWPGMAAATRPAGEQPDRTETSA